MSTTISFRLSDEEIEILKQERQGDESLQQIAQRLVRERLGTLRTSPTKLPTVPTSEHTDRLEKLYLELLQRVDRIENETLGKFAA